ncbi:MAG TPA: hypothetical protein VL551_20315 [Actinospica sp.]|nr:hypothetical protein [Actinospica sp.]
MESLERFVVHVEEAVRFAAMDDVPHLRLGLVLLDGAAELLLLRECEAQLYFADQARRSTRQVQRAQLEMMDPYTRPFVFEHPESTPPVSADRRKRINWDFGAKCDFLVERGVLLRPIARVLKKLHKYRNKAYHRDQIRLATLASATRIYIFLVCWLMQNAPVRFLQFPSTQPAWVSRYLHENESIPDLMAGEGFHARIATKLLTDANIDTPFELGRAFSEHYCDRLDAIQDVAEAAALFFRRYEHDDDWDWEAALIRGQLDQPLPQLEDECRTALEVIREAIIGGQTLDQIMAPPRIMSSTETRSLKVRFPPAKLRRWRAQGERLASQDGLTAFAAFADLEDALEPLEALMDRFTTDLRREDEYQRYKAMLQASWPKNTATD